MRRWIIGVLAGLLGAAWAAPSVLLNGGFEDGMTGWTITMDAGGKACGAAGVIDTAQKLAGAQSLKLTLPGKGMLSVSSAKTAVEGGRDFFLTARYRSTGFSQKDKADIYAQGGVNWLDAGDKSLGVTPLNGISYQAQDAWIGIARLMTAPKGAVAAIVNLSLVSTQGSAPSALWLDQVQLRPWIYQPKPGRKTWVHNAATEGLFDGNSFRAVAEDTTKSGLAVIANPKYGKTGYLSAFLYLRDLKPGAYRITYRLKVAEPPAPDAVAVTISSESPGSGLPNSRAIVGREFAIPGAWQDFSMDFIVTPWSGYVGFGAVWAGGATMWLDTITIVEEEVFTDEQITALFY